MMNENFVKFVEDSDLTAEDKEMWRAVFKMLNESELGDLYDFTEGKPERLKLITENLKSKVEAIKSGNSDLSEKILDEEKKDIDQN